MLPEVNGAEVGATETLTHPFYCHHTCVTEAQDKESGPFKPLP